MIHVIKDLNKNQKEVKSILHLETALTLEMICYNNVSETEKDLIIGNINHKLDTMLLALLYNDLRIEINRQLFDLSNNPEAVGYCFSDIRDRSLQLLDIINMKEQQFKGLKNEIPTNQP